MSSHAFHQCYYHITWTTKNRLPMLTEGVLPFLLKCIEENCPKRGGILYACNAMPDHVHLCISLPPTTAVATFIGQMKGVTGRLFNQTFGEERHLMWQEGYGVVTFRKAETPKVVRYIENQQELHAKRKTSRLLEATEDFGDTRP